MGFYNKKWKDLMRKKIIKYTVLFLIIVSGFLSIIFFSRKSILSLTRNYRYTHEAAKLKEQVSEKQSYEYYTLVGDSVEKIAREWRNFRGYTSEKDLEAFGQGVYSYTSLLAEEGIIKDSFESASSHAVMIILNDDVYMTCEPALKGYNAGNADNAPDLNIIGASLFNGASLFKIGDENWRKLFTFTGRNKYVSTFIDNLTSFTIHPTYLHKSTTVTEVKNILEGVDNSTRLFFWEGHVCLYDTNDSLTLSYRDGVCYTVSINEKVTEDNTKDYAPFLLEHSVVVNASGDSYKLTNTFFEKYLSDTEKGLFVTGCCYSDNEFLIDALKSHGFTSIACCKGSVSGHYARNMMNSIAKYLCQKDKYGRYLSIQAAYNNSIEEFGYGKDDFLWVDLLKYMNLRETEEDKIAPFRIISESVMTFSIYEKQEELVDNIEISLMDSNGNEQIVEYHDGDESTTEGFWTRIPAGTYKYEVTRDGTIISEQEINIPYQDEIIPIIVDLDGYRVSGRVVDSDNNPIEDAKVTLQDFCVNTDVDGYYIFTLQENSFSSISINANGYSDYNTQINLEDYKHADIITLPDIVLNKYVVCQGTIVSEKTYAPIANALVRFNDAESKSNSDGSFIIKTPSSARYEFVITADGYQNYSRSFPDDASGIGATITFDRIELKKINSIAPILHNPEINSTPITSPEEFGHKVTYDCIWFGISPDRDCGRCETMWYLWKKLCRYIRLHCRFFLI